MRFNTVRTEAVTKPQAVSTIDPEFGYYYDDDGVRQFGVTGVRDCQAQLNRFKDSCDYSLLKKYLIDNNALISDRGSYGERVPDMSDPNDLAVFMAKANTLYQSLPDIVKSKYKNMYEVVNNFNEKDFKKLFDSIQASDPVVSDSEGGAENG